MPQDAETTAPALTQQQQEFVTKWILSGRDQTVGSAYGRPHRSQDGSTLALSDAPSKIKDHLDGTAQGMVSAAEWDEVGKEMDKRAEAFMSDFDNKIGEAEAEVKPLDKVQKVLPVLETPGNNPERAKVGAQLKAYEWQRDKLKKEIQRESDPAKKAALQKKLVTDQAKHLNELEATVNAWFNRRTEKGLPPTAEALAMADLIQKEHKAMIETCIAEGISPPPVADMSAMTQDEIDELKKTWDNLVSQGGPIKIRDGDGTVDAGVEAVVRQENTQPSHGSIVVNDLKMKQLRVQVLSDLSRLLGSPSGRDLVTGLEKSGKNVYFTVGKDPECRFFPGQAMASGGTVDSPTPSATGGGSSVVCLPLDRKNSDEILRTKDGNLLYSPTHVIVGHELVHALHMAHGEGRSNMPGLAQPAMWTDHEELWTIKKGELSEQTLRNDYGMSAARFGHSFPNPKDSLGEKAIAQAKKSKKLADLRDGAGDKDPVDVERVLAVDMAFGDTVVAMMDDAIKVDLYDEHLKDDTFKGPLPAGWDPTRLNVDKIRKIIAGKLPYRMEMLGWRAYNLPYDKGAPNAKTGFDDSLQTITQKRVHHPRSSAGRRFTELGGKTTITAFAGFKTATGLDLGSWSDDDWRSNLHCLNMAAASVDKLCKSVPFIRDAGPPNDIKDKDALAVKMTKAQATITADMGGDAAEAGRLFADDACTHFRITDPDKNNQLAALKVKKTELEKEAGKLKLPEGGLTLADMSLVALDAAIKAFKGFPEPTKAMTHFQAVLDAENRKKKSQEYQAGMTEMENVSRRLLAIHPPALADAIDKIVLKEVHDLQDDVMADDDFGEMVEDLEKYDTESAQAIYKQVSPKIGDILNNAVSEDAFETYLGSLFLAPVFDFYTALKGRKTVRIADLAQGDTLIKAGFKQDTIVHLGRDAQNAKALDEALTQCLDVMQGHVEDFIRSLAETG